MRKKYLQYFSNRTKITKQASSVLVVLIVAGIGTYLLISSHAASPYASITADKGTLTNGAVSQSCTGAGDGNCVVFGAAARTGTTYYVSPSGSDSNSGTSASSPWQSMSKEMCIRDRACCTSPSAVKAPANLEANGLSSGRELKIF